MTQTLTTSTQQRWAQLRFAIVGPLLAAPPPIGELRNQLEDLSKKTWCHPTTGLPVTFSFATIERWFYAVRRAQDPIRSLRRKQRDDAGQPRCLSQALSDTIKHQYLAHQGWTVQLHYDNLVERIKQDSTLGPLPSYASVLRHMRANAWHRQKRPKRQTAGTVMAEERLERREVRSFEVDHVQGLWHLDFHHGSRQIITSQGRWVKPMLLAIMDDHSRLVCHCQWYLDETTEALVHGVSQAIQKRGLPRALLTDNGSAMSADEFCQGLERLSILHKNTLPYSAYQNGKQEVIWAFVEGRLMAMLESVADLTLTELNDITQAWVEEDYNRHHHREIDTTPLRRFLDSPSVSRTSPSSQQLRQAFRQQVTRRQRRSDGTLSLAGGRFEIPNCYRSLEKITVHYARWNLSAVDMVDSQSHAILSRLYPLDKSANANGHRRPLAQDVTLPKKADGNPPSAQLNEERYPPLLKKLIEDYAATGKPPAYLPQQKVPQWKNTLGGKAPSDNSNQENHE